MRWRSLSTAAVAAGLFLAGCGSLQNGRGWGQDVTLLPGFSRLGKAAAAAALDPYTWAPAAGAAAFVVSGADRRVSDWASNHTPVYGSREAASDASDTLKSAAGLGALATALATPSGSEPGEWLWSKAKGIGVEWAAVGATQTTTGALKELTGRERPDGSNRQSFPSAHSSAAFAYATLGRRNLDAIEMNPVVRSGLGIGFTTLAAATAWARVEAEKHFPSDVLAAAALANFTTSFICRSFLGIEESNDMLLGIEPAPHGVVLEFRGRY